MKKNIFTQEWMSMHPYTKIDDVDIYYTNLANRIYHALDTTCFIHQFNNPMDAKYLALCLAAYFEDVISGTCIWKAFTTECKKRYGVCVPFYLGESTIEGCLIHEGSDGIPEYDPDEINLADIKFILWHHSQQNAEAQTIIPPLFGTLEPAAKSVYDILNSEYETAPENERMHTFLCDMPLKEDDFGTYFMALEWFQYGCFFNVGNNKRLALSMQWLAQNGNYNQASAFAVRTDQIFGSRANLLSLTSQEWLAKVSEMHPAHKLWTDTDYRPNRTLVVEREDEKYIYAKDQYQKDVLKINKMSFNINDYTPFINGDVAIITNVVRLGSTWWQIGAVSVPDNDKNLQKYVREERERLNHKQSIKDYNMLKDNGYGSNFVFADNVDDAVEFVKSLGYDRTKNLKLPPAKETGVIVYGSPYTGLSIAINIAHCICSPDNPYYDAAKAEQNCFDIISGRGNAFPYEIVCRLIAGNMLPDANMFASKYLKDIGRRITQENLPFLADYYLSGRLDKDISPMELW